MLILLIRTEIAADKVQIRVQHEFVQVDLNWQLTRRSHDRPHRPCRGPIRRANDLRRIERLSEVVMDIASGRLIIQCFRSC